MQALALIQRIYSIEFVLCVQTGTGGTISHDSTSAAALCHHKLTGAQARLTCNILSSKSGDQEQLVSHC